MGVPQNGYFIWENPIKMDNLGVPLFQETSISLLELLMSSLKDPRAEPLVDQPGDDMTILHVEVVVGSIDVGWNQRGELTPVLLFVAMVHRIHQTCRHSQYIPISWGYTGDIMRQWTQWTTKMGLVWSGTWTMRWTKIKIQSRRSEMDFNIFQGSHPPNNPKREP